MSTTTAERSSRRRIVRERRGAMLAFVAVAMTLMLGFLAIVIDIGAATRQRRAAQEAADAAAMAGAAELYKDSTATTKAYSAARAVATSYGFTSAQVADTVPATGPYTNNPKYVEVKITKSSSSIFGSFYNRSSIATQARAVAGVGSYSLTCIYLTDPSVSTALSLSNGAGINADCGISVNSSSSTALDNPASGQITATGGTTVVGGKTGKGKEVPSAILGAAAVPTPLVLPADALGPCTKPVVTTIAASTNISPGVYCGGINITGGTVTMNAGKYVMVGGGFSVGKSATVDGTSGITIVNGSNASSPFAPFTFAAGCNAELHAPTSGTLNGILLMQDVSAPADADNQFGCVTAGSGVTDFIGVLYFPTENLSFPSPPKGRPLTNIHGTIIAKRLNLGIAANLNVTTNRTSNGPIKRALLVE